ncbi:hypothetical protein, partial [Succinimonas amylolytica]|uniref:hypothetical protein n=1 Tax=Succinimonas amylolytica TaxID=83769 RepID=UPI0023A8B28F
KVCRQRVAELSFIISNLMNSSTKQKMYTHAERRQSFIAFQKTEVKASGNREQIIPHQLTGRCS